VLWSRWLANEYLKRARYPPYVVWTKRENVRRVQGTSAGLHFSRRSVRALNNDAARKYGCSSVYIHFVKTEIVRRINVKFVAQSVRYEPSRARRRGAVILYNAPAVYECAKEITSAYVQTRIFYVEYNVS